MSDPTPPAGIDPTTQNTLSQITQMAQTLGQELTYIAYEMQIADMYVKPADKVHDIS